jgi:hypothetical protein
VVVSIKPDADKRETRRMLARQLTRILQTIHGLINAEDDETPAVAGSADKREERETGKDCRGVRVNVDSNELALGDRESDGSAKVKISEVGSAKRRHCPTPPSSRRC